jgi:hypothetical protein
MKNSLGEVIIKNENDYYLDEFPIMHNFINNDTHDVCIKSLKKEIILFIQNNKRYKK